MAKLSANGATILARYRKGDAKAALRSDGAFLVAWIKGDGYSIHHKTRAANKLEPRALISMWDDWSAERGWTKEGIVTTNPNLSDDIRLGRKAPDPRHPIVFPIVEIKPVKVTLVGYRNTGTTRVHAEGCADIKRDARGSDSTPWTIERTTKREVASALYGPEAGGFYEESGGDEVHGSLDAYLDGLITAKYVDFAPCVSHMPLRLPKAPIGVKPEAVPATIGDALDVALGGPKHYVSHHCTESRHHPVCMGTYAGRTCECRCHKIAKAKADFDREFAIGANATGTPKTSSLHSAGTRVTMVGKTERDPNRRPRNMENRTMATKSTTTKTQATVTASTEKKSPTEAELRALVAPFVKEGATASATIKALRAKGYSFSGKKVRVHFEGRTVKASPAKATMELATSRQKARAAKTAKDNETREARVQPPAPKPAVRKGAAFIDPDEVAKTRRANREAARAATQDLVTHGSFAEDAPKKKAAVRKHAEIVEAPKGTPSVKPPVRGIARSSTRRAMATASK